MAQKRKQAEAAGQQRHKEQADVKLAMNEGVVADDVD
jgi:hypothetical protein